MSRFERANAGDAWTEGPDAEEPLFPDDFSVEEATFASELREIFALEREELPPLYTQTLLEDERLDSAEAGFEQKLTYRVMRRLRLPRSPLFERHYLALFLTALQESLFRMSRPLAASLTTVMFVMSLTVAISTPTFAAGVRILLGQTGVQQVPAYPTYVRAPAAAKKFDHHQLTFDPNMKLSWLGALADKYLYQGARLQDPAEFSKGPIVEMQYTVDGHANGTGVLDIREFQVNDNCSAVLQVIQDGSQSLVKFGDTPAVYVDGTWVARDMSHRVIDGEGQLHWQWQTGVRSELIFERDGVVFWIVGDQRDGMQQEELLRIASLLKPVDPRVLQPDALTLRLAGNSLAYTFSDPVGHEVYAMVSSDTAPGTGEAAFVSSRG